MIKQLHSKNTKSSCNFDNKLNPEMTMEQLLQEISKTLIAPRPQAVSALLTKAKSMNLV
jgi:hypothetical protein